VLTPAYSTLSIRAGSSLCESIAVGDSLPEMPIFLKPDFYVPAPLEATYQSSWSRFPAAMKRLLEPPGGSPDKSP